MAPPLLEVDRLSASYGSAAVLHEVCLSLDEGELLLLAGPNGAGKSTLLRTIIGLHRRATGRISLHGRDIDQDPPHTRARAGLALVPEGRGVVGQLSVEENLDLARFSSHWNPAARETSFARFPILKKALKRPASSLSGGEQQMLALARALETGARMIMVDEPSLGLAPIIVESLFEHLSELRDHGYSILLVEEKAANVARYADRILLIRNGRVDAWEGRPGEEFDLTAYTDVGTGLVAR